MYARLETVLFMETAFNNYNQSAYEEAAKHIHHWWRFLVIAVVAIALGAAGLFAGLVGYYWLQIENGRSGNLAKEFNQSILMSAGGGGLAQKRLELETETAPFLGNPDAKIVLVEFVDFKCPNSKNNAPITHRLAEKYGYKVKIIARHLPVESARPGSTALAVLAYCAGRQGRFWEMHDLLFANQDILPADLTPELLESLSNQASADWEKMKICVADPKSLAEVNHDYSVGIKYGARGTPTFFLDGQRVQGTVAFEDWQKVFDKL